MADNDEESGIGSIILTILLIWGGVQLWHWIFPKNSDTSSSSYPSSYSSNKYNRKEDCLEPENPYDEGSGHYAGFEWGQNGNSCGGNSSSFIEGCEDYEAQQEAYDTCLSN
jgi:hypothetical protein